MGYRAAWRWTTGVLVGWLMLCAVPAHAAWVTYQFTGDINYADNPIAGTFALGGDVTGSFTVDTGVASSGLGMYVGALKSFSIAVQTSGGSYVASASQAGGNVTLGFNGLDDVYVLEIPSGDVFGNLVGGYALESLTLTLIAAQPFASYDDGLPQDPSAFAGGFGNLGFIDRSLQDDFAQTPFASFQVTHVTAVPEPGSMALASLGMIALAAAGHRRRCVATGRR